MTTTPSALPAPGAQQDLLRLSELLGRPLVDRSGQSIGRLSDVIARSPGRRLGLLALRGYLVVAVGLVVVKVVELSLAR